MLREGAGRDRCATDPVGELFNDLIPHYVCCARLGNPACEAFRNETQSPDDTFYDPPTPPRRTFGDPHFQTLDGHGYDFNGAGEYVAFWGSNQNIFSACHPDALRLDGNRTSINFLLAQRTNNDTGTVVAGVSLEDPLHRDGRFAVAVLLDRVRRVVVYDGVTQLNFPTKTSALGTVQLSLESGATVERTADLDAREIMLRFRMPSGIVLDVMESGGMLNPTLSLVDESWDAVGLYGRPDGDTFNNFTSSEGVVVPINSSSEEVFQSFGKTWLIQTLRLRSSKV